MGSNSTSTHQQIPWQSFVVGGLVLIVIIQGGWLGWQRRREWVPTLLSRLPFTSTVLAPPSTSSNLENLATMVREKCANAPYKPSCFDDEIPKLMETISMEDAFRVTRFVQNQEHGYFYCHVLGHRLSARETKKDPSKWKEVVGRCASGVCSNGCIHGAFQERFRTDALPQASVAELKPELESVCEGSATWHPTGMERASCYHALGHLTMYITQADIHKAVALCDEVAVHNGRDYRQLCYDGAFMQIYQPLEAEDFALIKGKFDYKSVDEHLRLCREFPLLPRTSCWTEGWPLYRSTIHTADGIQEFCQQADPTMRTRCYQGMFYVATTQLGLDSEVMTKLCTPLPTPIRALCFAQAASRMIETDWQLTDRAVALCQTAAKAGVGEACYQELLFQSSYNFRPNSPEHDHLCTLLPEPYQKKCRSGEIQIRPPAARSTD